MSLTDGRRVPWYRRVAVAVSWLSLALVFVLFLYGIGMRHLFGRPISWVDEAVTVLSVWSVLWTAAFVLRWDEHISFDIVFVNMAARRQRRMLMVAGLGYLVLMGAALPGMVDYTLFLWRERTDMLQMRLDFVYAIYPVFFAVMLLRLAASLWRLRGGGWRAELRRWGADASEERG